MINLLPFRNKKELLSEERWRIFLILGIVFLAFLICFSLILYSIKIYLSGQITVQRILLETEEKKFKTSETQNLEKEISFFNKELLELKSFYQKQLNPTEILEKISATLPDGVYLTTLSFNPLTGNDKYLIQISLSGFCPAREILIAFKQNLESVENFGEVDFPPSNWLELTDINFSVTFKAK